MSNLEPSRPKTLTFANMLLIFKVVVDALRYFREFAKKS